MNAKGQSSHPGTSVVLRNSGGESEPVASTSFLAAVEITVALEQA